MNPAQKLTRKQRNRIAADKSRKKRLDEQKRLRERVRQLEMVNELLKRENERLLEGRKDSDSLLSASDLDLLRKLTAIRQGESNERDETCPSMRDDINLTSCPPFIETMDPATTTTPATTTRDKVDDFKPAALEYPLQKESLTPTVSLRRRLLAAMMAPRMVNSLKLTNARLTSKRINQILLGSKNIFLPASGAPTGENRFVAAMFPTVKFSA